MSGFLADASLIPMHAAAVMLGLNFMLILLVGNDNFLPTLNRRLRPFAYAFMALALAWTIGHPFFFKPEDTVPRWATGGTLVFMGAFFGLTFYATKIHRPVIYGAIEIGAGICGLIVVALINPANSVLVLIFGFATSVYIIVRGLTNMNDALNAAELPKKQDEEPTPPPREKVTTASGSTKPRNNPGQRKARPLKAPADQTVKSD